MITLYNCDCLEFMKSMDDKSVDAVITDPPYGMNKAEWDKEIPDWISLIGEVPAAIFCGVIGMRDYPVPDWVGAWVRVGSTQRVGFTGGFNNWEPILFYKIKKLENDVIVAPNYHEKYDHPTVKPIKLMKTLIQRMTQPNDTIFDPFMGSGTTGVACVQLGRNFIGCEIDPDYFKIAEKRIHEATLQPSLFTNTVEARQDSLI